MKPWIRRTLIGLSSVTVLLGGLSACGHRPHGQGWSEERMSEMRAKVVDKVSRKLALDEAQKVKLGALADEMLAARKAVRGGSPDPRTEIRALVAGTTFDRTRAQGLFAEKTHAMQGSGPKVIEALGNFYDSLRPEQQQQVREMLDKRRGWGWRG